MLKEFRTYTLAVLAMAFWGLSFVWTKIVYKYYHPFAVVFIRLVISSALLLMYSRSKRDRIARPDILPLLILSMFEPLLYFLCESLGLKYVSSTVASLIIAMIPVLIPVGAFLFLRERLSGSGIIGLIISLAGVASLILGPDLTFRYSPLGILLMLGAVLSAVSYNLICARLVKKYSPLTLVTWQNTAGVLYFLPLFLIYGLDSVRQTPVAGELVLNILNLAVFSSTLAFVFNNQVIQDIGVSRTNIFTNLIPVFTALSAYLLLGESFDLAKLASMAVIISGVAISQLKPAEKPAW
ncbi:MAG: DMT family transporter [Candidatus Wallbacteria bacterium]|nr:DMT family transporter [Candidatus Wallbacteria bacterium]